MSSSNESGQTPAWTKQKPSNSVAQLASNNSGPPNPPAEDRSGLKVVDSSKTLHGDATNGFDATQTAQTAQTTQTATASSDEIAGNSSNYIEGFVHGKIFVGGLPWNTSSATLSNYFEKYGAVTDVTMLIDGKTNQPRGFAFISFADHSVTVSILESNADHFIDGRKVDVKIALRRQRKQFANAANAPSTSPQATATANANPRAFHAASVTSGPAYFNGVIGGVDATQLQGNNSNIYYHNNQNYNNSTGYPPSHLGHGGSISGAGQYNTWPAPRNKIFVGGLGPDVSDVELRTYFSQFGDIAEAIVMIDKLTGRSRRFGFVTFEQEESVESVCARSHTFNSKAVEVKRAEPRDVQFDFYDRPPHFDSNRGGRAEGKNYRNFNQNRGKGGYPRHGYQEMNGAQIDTRATGVEESNLNPEASPLTEDNGQSGGSFKGGSAISTIGIVAPPPGIASAAGVQSPYDGHDGHGGVGHGMYPVSSYDQQGNLHYVPYGNWNANPGNNPYVIAGYYYGNNYAYPVAQSHPESVAGPNDSNNTAGNSNAGNINNNSSVSSISGGGNISYNNSSSFNNNSGMVSTHANGYAEVPYGPAAYPFYNSYPHAINPYASYNPNVYHPGHNPTGYQHYNKKSHKKYNGHHSNNINSDNSNSNSSSGSNSNNSARNSSIAKDVSSKDDYLVPQGTSSSSSSTSIADNDAKSPNNEKNAR